MIQVKRIAGQVLFIVFVFINLIHCIRCSNEGFLSQEESKHQMIAYGSIDNITYIDYVTLENLHQLKVPIPSDMSLNFSCMVVSSNQNHLIFLATSTQDYKAYFLTYSLEEDKMINCFPAVYDRYGSPHVIAAYDPNSPGLLYWFTHLTGFCEVDFIKQEVRMIEPIEDNYYYLDFYVSPNRKLMAQVMRYPRKENSFVEIEIFQTEKRVKEPEFVLNQNDCDRINPLDLKFSEDNHTLFLSYTLSQQESTFDKMFFGSYDLINQSLDSCHLILPWISNGFNIELSSSRSEAYLCGQSDTLYFINTLDKDYYIKEKVILEDKFPVWGSSNILLSPDESKLFVSCGQLCRIFVINLETRKIIKKIKVRDPYNMKILS